MSSLKQRLAEHGFISDQDYVNTPAQLRQSIYGWVEGIDRTHLMSAYVDQVLERQWPVLRAYLGRPPALHDISGDGPEAGGSG